MLIFVRLSFRALGYSIEQTVPFIHRVFIPVREMHVNQWLERRASGGTWTYIAKQF